MFFGNFPKMYTYSFLPGYIGLVTLVFISSGHRNIATNVNFVCGSCNREPHRQGKRKRERRIVIKIRESRWGMKQHYIVIFTYVYI